MAEMSKSEAVGHLQRVREQIQGLEEGSTDSSAFIEWRRDTRIAIENVFGKGSGEASEFANTSFYPPSIGISVIGSEAEERARDERWQQESYSNGLIRSKSLLKSMIDQIRTYWLDESEPIEPDSDLENTKPSSNKVLIVHGTDAGIKNEVARLIEKLGLEAIILEEQPSMGRTLIDKFEQMTDEVEFATVLLTPDDEGRKKDTDKLTPRARQNVILELGFVSASLGRHRVCALRKGNVEIPSDYSGVVYVSMDDQDWKLKYIRELKTAGYEVDANRI